MSKPTNLLHIYSVHLSTNKAKVPTVTQYSNTHDSLIFDTNAGEVAIISNPEVRAEAREIAEELAGTVWVLEEPCVLGRALMKELGTIANVAREARRLPLPAERRTPNAPSDKELAEELLAKFGAAKDQEQPEPASLSVGGRGYYRRGGIIDSFPARTPDGDEL